MSTSGPLDQLRADHPVCHVAAIAELDGDAVLLASYDTQVTSTDDLDALCAQARSSFAGALGDMSGAQDADAPGPVLHMGPDRAALSVYVKASDAPGVVLCCRCAPDCDPAAVLDAAAACLTLMVRLGTVPSLATDPTEPT